MQKMSKGNTRPELKLNPLQKKNKKKKIKKKA